MRVELNLNIKAISAVVFFSIAMAALESAVVVYLRELYYTDGFTVALKLIDQRILLVEMAREIATLVMLIMIGYLSGRNFKDRFAYFLLSFAIWDIFYYVWLKVFIDWPASLLDWDIVFLIPFTWLGPVLAPVICSATMLVLALVILQRNPRPSISLGSLFFAGSSIILFTFLKDYAIIIVSHGFLKDYFTLLQNKEFLSIASNYVPQSFSWRLFALGEVLIAAGIVKIINERLLTDVSIHN